MSITRPTPRTTVLLPVVAAVGASGAAGYVVLVLTARVLDPATNAAFLVYWGALFAVFGALVGLTTETTRAVFSAGGDGTTLVLPVVLGLGGAAALLVGTSGLVWGPQLFGDPWAGLLAAMVTGILLFTTHSAFVGSAAGSAAWNHYSLLVGSEAVSRLVLCIVVALAGGRLLGLAWAVSLACGTLVVWLLASNRFRRLATVRADVGRAGLTKRMLAGCAASGVSAFLLVGYPVLLRLTTPDDVFAGAAPLVLAVSLARAPLMVPLGIFQNVIVTSVITRGVQVLRGAMALLGAATAVGVGLAWLSGPWLLRMVNPTYHVSGPVFAALVVTAGLVALLTITGAATLALDRHTAYLAGWVAATAAALLPLLSGWDLEQRVVSSLVIGPLVGVAIHVWWGLRVGARAGRTARAPS